MEFTLTIKGNPHELAALLANAKSPSVEGDSLFPAIEPEFPAAMPTPSTNGHVAAEVAKPAAPKPKAPAAPKPKAPVVADIPADDAEEPVTLDKLRLLAKQKIAQQPQIIEILGNYGAANLSSLDAECYDAVYEQISAL